MSKRRALNGRVATQADQDAEEVIFYIPDGRSVLYRFQRELPLRARLVGETSGFPVGTEIEILQAETGDTGDVLIGFMVGEDEGICLLHEVERSIRTFLRLSPAGQFGEKSRLRSLRTVHSSNGAWPFFGTCREASGYDIQPSSVVDAAAVGSESSRVKNGERWYFRLGI